MIPRSAREEQSHRGGTAESEVSAQPRKSRMTLSVASAASIHHMCPDARRPWDARVGQQLREKRGVAVGHEEVDVSRDEQHRRTRGSHSRGGIVRRNRRDLPVESHRRHAVPEPVLNHLFEDIGMGLAEA